METKNETKAQSMYYRFQVFTGRINNQGKVEKDKTVGYTYHESGLRDYFLRMWMWPENPFFLSASKNDPSVYYIKTKIPNKRANDHNSFIWMTVGSGKVIPRLGVIQLKFDLISYPIFMNIFPDRMNPKEEEKAEHRSTH